jgi:V/A-type H+-transporting ATPase subunit K
MSDTRNRKHSKLLRTTIRVLLTANAVLAIAILVMILVSRNSSVVAAGPAAQGITGTSGLNSQVALGAALSTGLAALGAGIAVGMVGSAALGTIAERPETFGRAIIFVGLAEGIAIYGLITTFLLLSS